MIFFGTSSFSIYVLDQLLELGMVPDAIVTVPDRPAGRKLVLTPPPVKLWAIEKNIPYFQFEKLNADAAGTLTQLSEDLRARSKSDIYIVASYGKIIPQAVLDIPAHGALNVHPSLLPKLRGATPLQSSIMLDMQDTGVTIIQMDKEMDHGPIVAQHQETITPWPQPYIEFEAYLAKIGAKILADALPSYLDGTSRLIEQNHADATFTKKIGKADGLVSLDELSGPAGWKNFLKYNALMEWPGLYFFSDIKHGAKNSKGNGNNADSDGKSNATAMRVKIKEARWNADSETMEILRVVPEGKKEMTWKDFANYAKTA